MSGRLKSHVFHICTRPPSHTTDDNGEDDHVDADDDADVNYDDDDEDEDVVFLFTCPVPCHRVWSSRQCGSLCSARSPLTLRSRP